MIGFGLGAIGALILYGIRTPLELIFLRFTGFLFWWYLVTTLLFATPFLLSSIGIVMTPLERVAKLAIGGTIALTPVIVLFDGILLTLGAYLLRNSVRLDAGSYEWNIGLLGVGFLFLIGGLIINSRRRRL